MASELFALAGIAQGIDKALDRQQEINLKRQEQEQQAKRLDIMEKQAANESKFQELTFMMKEEKLKNESALFDLKKQLGLAERQKDLSQVEKEKATTVIQGSQKISEIIKQRGLSERRLGMLMEGRQPEDLTPDELREKDRYEQDISLFNSQIKDIETVKSKAIGGDKMSEYTIENARQLSPNFKFADDSIDKFAARHIQTGALQTWTPENFKRAYIEAHKDTLKNMSSMERKKLNESIDLKFPNFKNGAMDR